MKRIVQRNAFVRIVRFHEYGPCYLVSALACAFVAGYPVDSRIPPVLLFLVLALFVSVVLVGGLPWILLAVSPSIIFFVAPIINALRYEQKEQELMPAFVNRGTIIGLLLLVTYLAVKIAGAG